jgi:hypothetical protein
MSNQDSTPSGDENLDPKEKMRRALEAKKNRGHIGGPGANAGKGIGPQSSNNKVARMFRRKSGSA